MGDEQHEPSIESDHELVIEDAPDLNPEGYGIDDVFVPLAVFDSGEEEEEINLFDVAEEGKLVTESEGEEGELPTVQEEGEGGEEETKGEGEELEEGEEEKEEEEEEAKEEEEEEAKVEEVEKEKHEEEEEKGKGVKFGQAGEGTDGQGKLKKRRMSIRKKSIFYPIESRFRSPDERRVSGDFKAYRDDIIGETESPPSISSFHMEGEYVYEEEVEEEEEETPIDREFYYSKYKALIPERNVRRMKNNFLHRKMAEYFKKRKMEHVLKEVADQDDSQLKYDKKLEALGELKELDTRERNSITAELNDLRSQRNEQLTLLNHHFSTMQNREKEIGMGLINTKTGKQIPDKLVERLINRQRDKSTEVATMRLVYIKLRDKVTEKKNALHALDCIGDNLHLIDFEQLKIEHQSHTDKIEERDEELTRLRTKCSSAMQCLAHVREKSAAVILDMIKLTERLEEIQDEYMDCRERLNYFKQQRDTYRAEKDRLSEESGLLTKPKLLRDMEAAMKEAKLKSEELEKLKQDNTRIKAALRAIKTNIDNTTLKVNTSRKTTIVAPTKTAKIYRGRPTLIYPELPQGDWSDFD